MFGRLPGIDSPVIQSAGRDNSPPNNDTIIVIPPAAPVENELVDAPRSPSSCYVIATKAAGAAAFSIPLVNAGMEAVQTAIGLADRSAYFIGPVTTVNFFSALSINLKFTVPGITKSVSIIKNRQLPAKWHKLSTGKEIFAAGASVTLATYSAFTDSALGYFFIMELPAQYMFTNSINMTGWKVLAGIGAAYTGVGIFTSEGMATYKQTRKLLGGIKPTYKNKASAIISPSAGFVLGTFNSINDSIATFSGMVYVFDITSTPALGTVLALSSINGVTDYSINGLWIIEILDDFIGSFTPAEGVAPAYTRTQVVAAFAASIGAGTLLAYAWHSLAKTVMNETLASVGINATAITDPIVEVLACGGATSNLVNGAGSIYPVLYKAAGALGATLAGIYNCMPSWCQTETPEIAADPLLGFTNEELETNAFLDHSEGEAERIDVDDNHDNFVDALDHAINIEDSEEDVDVSNNDEFFDAVGEPADVIDIDNLSEDEKSTAAFLFNLFTPARPIPGVASDTQVRPTSK